MSGSGVRQQIQDVLSSAQLKNLELKSLTIIWLDKVILGLLSEWLPTNNLYQDFLGSP